MSVVAKSSRIGDSVRRKEDLHLLTGKGTFSDDVNLPGEAFVIFVRSPHAHARIRSIDVRPALAVPGVLMILTGQDMLADGLKPLPHVPMSTHHAERKTGSIIALGGSSMVTVSSGYGAAVVSSKMGLHGLIKSLAQALAPHGVRANLLGLANIENDRRNLDWYKNMAKTGKPDITSPERAKLSPMGRKGHPQEVANVALLLASDESSYITGDRILCAGGMQV